MKYASQKVAFWYFTCAMVLFAVQITAGTLAGTVYVLPNTLAELLPFNIIRMIHTNALVVWLLMGFFGCAYYLVPEEAERDIESPTLAYIQLGLLMFGALAAVKRLIRAPDYAFTLDRAARGLGKTLWWGPFKLKFYGLRV